MFILAINLNAQKSVLDDNTNAQIRAELNKLNSTDIATLTKIADLTQKIADLTKKIDAPKPALTAAV